MLRLVLLNVPFYLATKDNPPVKKVFEASSLAVQAGEQSLGWRDWWVRALFAIPPSVLSDKVIAEFSVCLSS